MRGVAIIRGRGHRNDRTYINMTLNQSQSIPIVDLFIKGISHPNSRLKHSKFSKLLGSHYYFRCGSHKNGSETRTAQQIIVIIIVVVTVILIVITAITVALQQVSLDRSLTVCLLDLCQRVGQRWLGRGLQIQRLQGLQKRSDG